VGDNSGPTALAAALQGAFENNASSTVSVQTSGARRRKEVQKEATPVEFVEVVDHEDERDSKGRNQGSITLAHALSNAFAHNSADPNVAGPSASRPSESTRRRRRITPVEIDSDTSSVELRPSTPLKRSRAQRRARADSGYNVPSSSGVTTRQRNEKRGRVEFRTAGDHPQQPHQQRQSEEDVRDGDGELQRRDEADEGREADPLESSTKYFWRVSAGNAGGQSGFSPPFSFTTGLASYRMRKSWNLISLPLDVPDSRASVLFPGAVSGAFDYVPEAGYRGQDTLHPGRGYWIKFPDSVWIGMTGSPRSADTLPLEAGWNMIGTISQSIGVDSVAQDPPGIVTSGFFLYDGSYAITDTLEPARGYWVKAAAPGKIILRRGNTILPTTK